MLTLLWSFVPFQTTAALLEMIGGAAKENKVLTGGFTVFGLVVQDEQRRLLVQQQQMFSLWATLWAPCPA